MKISTVSKTQYITNFKGNNDDYPHLSGKNIIEKYNAQRSQIQNTRQEKYTEVQGVIYNSLENLASLGKYDAAKLLFKEIEDEEELKNDYSLYGSIANVYKKENDLAKANDLFEIAYKNADSENIQTFSEIEKNYLETQILLNHNTEEAVKEIGKRKDVFSNITFLELDSLNNLKKGDAKKSKNEIISAYFLAQNNNIVSDDLSYKTAVIYSADGNYEKSNEICKTRLDKLNKEQKIYTHEFLNYLTLLGINNAKSADSENDYKIAFDTLKNAEEIEKIIPNNIIKETIGYYLLKMEFNNPDNATLVKANDFLEYSKNENSKKEISILAGDYCINKDNELATLYYQNAEDFLNKNKDTNNSELLALYNKITAASPQKYNEYLQKINGLSEKKDLSLQQLVDTLELNSKQKNNEKIIAISNEIINNPKSPNKNKEIAKTYKLFTNIEQGEEFYKNVELLEANLVNISKMYDKDTGDKILSKHLYCAYTKLASINYDASGYYNAARNADKAQKYISSMNPTEADVRKSKIFSTMLWYKSKCYYDAEKQCSDYLKMLTGEKSFDLKNTSARSLIQNRSDDESRKIAAAIETLGIINLKNRNYNDAKDYYKKAIEIRENLRRKDLYLANDYAALARIAIVGFWDSDENLSSKQLHKKCLDFLKDKYKNEDITKEEEEFHKKYYGFSLASACKFLPLRNQDAIIDKFKCYNKELNICE